MWHLVTPGYGKRKDYPTWVMFIFYIDIVLLLVLEFTYVPPVEPAFRAFMYFLPLDAVKKGETDLSTKCYCLGLAFLIRLALCSWTSAALVMLPAALWYPSRRLAGRVWTDFGCS